MTNTVTLPQSIFKRLEKISASSKRSPASIVRQAVQDRLDYKEWFLKQVDAGLAELNTGKGISDETFWKKVGTIKNARQKVD